MIWGGVGHWYQISHSWMRGGVSTLCSTGFGVPSLFCEFAKLNKSSGQMHEVFKKHTITEERDLFPSKYQINLWMMEMFPAAHLITPLIKSLSAHKRWLINFHNLRGHNLHKFSQSSTPAKNWVIRLVSQWVAQNIDLFTSNLLRPRTREIIEYFSRCFLFETYDGNIFLPGGLGCLPYVLKSCPKTVLPSCHLVNTEHCIAVCFFVLMLA